LITSGPGKKEKAPPIQLLTCFGEKSGTSMGEEEAMPFFPVEEEDPIFPLGEMGEMNQASVLPGWFHQAGLEDLIFRVTGGIILTGIH
jgi:hypothetical protein